MLQREVRSPRAPRIKVPLRVAALLACGNGSQTAPPGELALRQAVVSELHGRIDGAGRFVLPAQALDRNGVPQIGPERARQLAAGWVHEFGPMNRESLQREHGDSIAFNTLSTCQRTMYARSPYLPVDRAVAVHPTGAIHLRALGPYWLVPFCNSQGQPVMLVAVSAHSTDVILDNSRLQFPPIGGEWFHWRGIRKGQQLELPVGPETAAIVVARLAGKRVVRVPELVLAARPQATPTEPAWRVTLEEEVTLPVRTTGTSRPARDLYAGYQPRNGGNSIKVAAQEQPAGFRFRYRTDVVIGQPLAPEPTYAEGFVQRDTEIPVDFDVITAIASEE